MLISLSELPEAIRVFVVDLRACVRMALDDFIQDHSRLRAKYSPRTEASIINDYMVWHAKDRFPWKLKRNLFLVEVGRDYRVKLKKLSGSFRTKNIPTSLALRFEQQRPLRLFDDLDLTHLFVGYQRHEAEISQSTIWIVCPQGKDIRWIADLTSADSGAESLNIAVTPTDPGGDVGGRRIKPRVAIAEGMTGEQKKDDPSENE